MKSATYTARPAMLPGTLLLCLSLAAPAFGQLTLDAFMPAHGATNVDTEATISLTFNEPLDTEAAFEIDDDSLFLGFDMSPFPLEPPVFTLNGLDVKIEVTLQADTQYWFLLRGARGESGADLDRPYAFTFTTGSRLPTATVSGTVDFDEGDPAGAFVGLFPETFFDDLFNDDEEDDDDGGATDGGGDDDGDDNDDLDVSALAIVTDASGAYTMDFVPPGRYVMLALKDVDQDGDPTSGDAGEGFGAYDANGDRVPDGVEVQDAALAGFDVALRSLALVTARANLPDAQNLASDAALTTALAAEVTPGGEAGIWAYFFYHENTRDTLGVVSFFHLLAPLSPNALRDSTDACDPILCDLTMPLPEDWIDSDAAMEIMEKLGGADYRARNREVETIALLLTTDFDETDGVLPRHGLPKTLPLSTLLPTGTPSTPQPVWLIAYQTPNPAVDDFLIGYLDAQTGEVVRLIGRPTSADDNEDDAQTAATAWQDDAQPVSVINIEPLDADGESRLWAYFYYSPATGTARSVLLSSGTVLDEGDVSPTALPSLDPLPENWVDSSVAAAEAETRSNNFRTQHPDAEVFAQLSRGFRPGDPDRAVWRFSYISEQDFAFLDLDVDAETGQVIVSAEDEAEVPEAVALHQNYPNPFNPETTITYEVHQTGTVELIVYNVLGQKVRTLVHTVQAPGRYTTPWNGTDAAGHLAPSGLYVYEVRLGNTRQTRVMTLLR